MGKGAQERGPSQGWDAKLAPTGQTRKQTKFRKCSLRELLVVPAGWGERQKGKAGFLRVRVRGVQASLICSVSLHQSMSGIVLGTRDTTTNRKV